MDSRNYQRLGKRPGVAPIVMAIIILVLISVAAASAYYFLQSPPSPPTSSTSSSVRTTTTSTGTSSTRSSSSGSAARATYSGTFSFSVPLGPGGERVLSNNTVQAYNTVQVASGSFTFFIDASNMSGKGSGQGTLVATTTGFCSGSTTVHYTFDIPDATTLLGGNVTVFMGDATPGMFMVPLTCTGDMNGVSTATNNPCPFLPTYPNEVTVKAIPATVSQHLTGNITYYFNIVQTG
jgi:hypothetical protein